MELVLIRHGLPERVEGATGPADPPLAPDGLDQARRVGEYLAAADQKIDQKIDAVYASPLLRARQTAAPLCGLLGVEARIADGVAEWDRHANEYVPVEELKASGDKRWNQMVDGTMEHDAETFARTVTGAIDEIIGAHPGQRVAVFCHGGVINAYLASVLGIAMRGPVFFYPNYTSIHRVAAASSGPRTMLAINEICHLTGTGVRAGIV